MFFKKVDKERLEKVEAALIVLGSAVIERDNLVGGLKGEIERLTKANADLMDRMMSTDFESYKTFTFHAEDEPEVPYDVLQDEELAGEVLDDETSGR